MLVGMYLNIFNLQHIIGIEEKSYLELRILHTLGFAILEQRDYLRGAEALIAWLELEEGHTPSNDTLFWSYESAKKIFWLTNSPIIHIRNMLLFFRLKCRLISWSRASLSAIIFLLNWKANLSSTNTKRALSRVSPLNDDKIHFHFFFQTKTHNLKDWKETHDSKHKDSVSPKITKTPKETANMKFLFLFLVLPLSNLTINTCYNNDKGTDNKQIQT